MPESSYYSTTAWQPERDSRPRRRGQLDKPSRSFRFQWTTGQKLSKDYVPDLVPEVGKWREQDPLESLKFFSTCRQI